MSDAIFGSNADLEERIKASVARRIRIDIHNQIPPSWGNAYAMAWTVWFSYLEIPSMERHNSPHLVYPGQMVTLYSNQPINADGGPCCKALAWEFRIPSSGQVLHGSLNMEPNRCLVAHSIGIAPKAGVSVASEDGIEVFSGIHSHPLM